MGNPLWGGLGENWPCNRNTALYIYNNILGSEQNSNDFADNFKMHFLEEMFCTVIWISLNRVRRSYIDRLVIYRLRTIGTLSAEKCSSFIYVIWCLNQNVSGLSGFHHFWIPVQPISHSFTHLICHKESRVRQGSWLWLPATFFINEILDYQRWTKVAHFVSHQIICHVQYVFHE